MIYGIAVCKNCMRAKEPKLISSVTSETEPGVSYNTWEIEDVCECGKPKWSLQMCDDGLVQ